MRRRRVQAGGRAPTGRVGARRTEDRHPGRGFQLYELLIVLAVLTITATISIPRLMDWTRGLRVELAANELVGVLRRSRSYAVRHGTKVGVKFWPAAGKRVAFGLYRDGDGDGVRSRDIDSGVDPPVGLVQQLAHMGAHVRFGFPPGPAPRDPGDPGRRMDRLDDPIRFNRSDIASFNHLGGSTPGSLYLTDGRSYLSVVRLFGRTGKVRVLRYDSISETWR